MVVCMYLPNTNYIQDRDVAIQNPWEGLISSNIYAEY